MAKKRYGSYPEGANKDVQIKHSDFWYADSGFKYDPVSHLWYRGATGVSYMDRQIIDAPVTGDNVIQKVEFGLSATTTDATETEMLANAQRWVVPEKIMLITLDIIASRNVVRNEACTWALKFVVANNGTTTQIVGNIKSDVHLLAEPYSWLPEDQIFGNMADETLGVWYVKLNATGGYITLTCAGENAKNIGWFAWVKSIELTETAPASGAGSASSQG
jgi:hypothetical protein